MSKRGRMKHKAKCKKCNGKGSIFISYGDYGSGYWKECYCSKDLGYTCHYCTKPQPKPNESTATDVFGRTFTLKEKLHEARANKLSQCCGAKVWISRLGKKVCTKCHKAEQPKPKSEILVCSRCNGEKGVAHNSLGQATCYCDLQEYIKPKSECDRNQQWDSKPKPEEVRNRLIAEAHSIFHRTTNIEISPSIDIALRAIIVMAQELK